MISNIKTAALHYAANSQTIHDIQSKVDQAQFTLEDDQVLISNDRLSKLSQDYLNHNKIDTKEVNQLISELKEIEYELKVAMQQPDQEDGNVIKDIEDVEPDTPNLGLKEFFDEISDEIDDILNKNCIHYYELESACLNPLLVGDLIKVEKELCRYQEGEIAQIENIMAKEKREFSVRDLTRITDYTETLREKEQEEETSTKVDERFQLDTQSQKAQQQNTSTNASFSGTYNLFGGEATIGANASYSNAKQASYNTSKQYAKDITEEASKRVKEHIKEIKKVTIVTEQVKNSIHGYDNTQGDAEHIMGIYRWVDKVYKAQMVDYGKRLFMEFMIPEPAFYLRELKEKIDSDVKVDMKKPIHPSKRRVGKKIKSFRDISDQNFAKVAAEYGVTDFNLIPPKRIIQGRGISISQTNSIIKLVNTSKDEDSLVICQKIEDVVIPEGYKITDIGVFVPNAFNEILNLGTDKKNKTRSIAITVGDLRIVYTRMQNESNLIGNLIGKIINLPESPMFSAIDKGEIITILNRQNTAEVNSDFNIFHSFGENDFAGIDNSTILPVSVIAETSGALSFNLIYKLERTKKIENEWKKNVYSKILDGYERQKQIYDQKVREAKLKKDSKKEQLVLQARESKYRKIESDELKKHCIDILSSYRARYVLQNLQYENDELRINLKSRVLPNRQVHNVKGSIVSFFEETFEWEQMSYQFYPYFWANKKRMADLFDSDETGDVLFDEFLKAGYAKVLIPIRPNYEKSVLYYLKYKRIWKGGEIPALNDLKFISYLEEIYDSKQLSKGNGEIVGDSWEIKLPTNFVILQKDGVLPTDLCKEPEHKEQLEEMSVQELEEIINSAESILENIEEAETGENESEENSEE